MKRLSIIILSVFAVAMLCGMLSSCKNKSTLSPQILFYNFKINGDSVKTDTIFLNVGDTLSYITMLQPYYDKIVSLQVETERYLVNDSILSDDDFNELCDLTQSDRKKGLYVFKNMKDGYNMTMQNHIIPLKYPDTDTNIVTITYKFKSSADVSGDFNPVIAKFGFVILKSDIE